MRAANIQPLLRPGYGRRGAVAEIIKVTCGCARLPLPQCYAKRMAVRLSTLGRAPQLIAQKAKLKLGGLLIKRSERGL